MRVVDHPQGYCRFGVARSDVTPPVGIYHRAWGAATHDRATGVHRPLTATALFFQDPGPAGPQNHQVVLALDHCLLAGPDMTDLLQVLSQRTGLAGESLLVAFSHTHAAGLMGRDRSAFPGGELVVPYLAELADQLAGLVEQARQGAQPAVIQYATGRCTLAQNRDLWDGDRQEFVCGYNPDGPADDTVLVARITAQAGPALATVVNYACHPTTLAWENTRISPDFPGAMRELVEEKTGVPCAFLQGASGDLGPRDGFVADPGTADRNGRQLGHAALAALEGLPPPATRLHYTGAVISGATLGTWAHVAREQEAEAHARLWRRRHWVVQLDYRPELRRRHDIAAELDHWQAEHEKAVAANDGAHARDCRALVERLTRWLTRLAALPDGPTFPLPVTVWQIGDGLWVGVEGEHYQDLQRSLRTQFPGVPIIVVTLANGSRCSYLPRADAYGLSLYQESIAVLASGSLEALTAAIADRIQEWRQCV